MMSALLDESYEKWLFSMFYGGDTQFYVRIDAFYFCYLCEYFVIDALTLSQQHLCTSSCHFFNSAKSMDIFRLTFDFSAMENAHHFQLLFQISFHVAIFALFSLRRKALKNMENVTIEKMLLF